VARKRDSIETIVLQPRKLQFPAEDLLYPLNEDQWRLIRDTIRQADRRSFRAAVLTAMSFGIGFLGVLGTADYTKGGDSEVLGLVSTFTLLLGFVVAAGAAIKLARKRRKSLTDSALSELVRRIDDELLH
jgi:hypothetical protein